MPIKYHCPKCGKRYVDWGAEKVGYRCPDCDDEELVRMGQPTGSNASRAAAPTLRRKKKKKAAPPPVAVPEEVAIDAEVGGEVIGDSAITAEPGDAVLEGDDTDIDADEEEELKLGAEGVKDDDTDAPDKAEAEEKP
jgi:DNA-directed RNA polymerase subunit RPC12/RpoP